LERKDRLGLNQATSSRVRSRKCRRLAYIRSNSWKCREFQEG